MGGNELLEWVVKILGILNRTIIELISATTASSGLTVRAEQDFNHYETGIKVSDEELATIPLKRHESHGDWNYTIAQSDSR